MICTLGADGVDVTHRGGVEHIAASAVDAVDTTAAGDTFIGYFAAHLVGAPDDILGAIRVAVLAAGVTVTRPGAIESIPYRRRTRKQRNDNGGKAMRIALGNDHAGYALKAHVRSVLEGLGHEVIDTGAQDDDPGRLPRYHLRHVRARCARATPTAPCWCAGRVRAPSWRPTRFPESVAPSPTTSTRRIRAVEHDDANAIAIGAWVIGQATAGEVIESFLAARFDNDDDTVRRVRKLHELELNAARQLTDELSKEITQ